MTFSQKNIHHFLSALTERRRIYTFARPAAYAGKARGRAKTALRQLSRFSPPRPPSFSHAGSAKRGKGVRKNDGSSPESRRTRRRPAFCASGRHARARRLRGMHGLRRHGRRRIRRARLRISPRGAGGRARRRAAAARPRRGRQAQRARRTRKPQPPRRLCAARPDPEGLRRLRRACPLRLRPLRRAPRPAPCRLLRPRGVRRRQLRPHRRGRDRDRDARAARHAARLGAARHRLGTRRKGARRPPFGARRTRHRLRAPSGRSRGHRRLRADARQDPRAAPRRKRHPLPRGGHLQHRAVAPTASTSSSRPHPAVSTPKPPPARSSVSSARPACRDSSRPSPPRRSSGTPCTTYGANRG